VVQMLKTLRGAKGWTQKQLADVSGISQTYISELEAAKSKPTVTVAIQLAQALGVELMELLQPNLIPEKNVSPEKPLREVGAVGDRQRG